MEMLRLSLLIIFHPITAFQYMQKDRSKFNYAPVLILLFLVIVARTLSIYITHFPLAAVDPRNANLLVETTKLLLPVITWAIASFAITAILDGETLIREAILATSYAMVPYIVFTVPLSILSLIMDKSQAALYNNIQFGILVWVILLFILSIKTMNSYSLKKTLLTCLLSLFTMLLIWATIVLFFAISSQFFDFIKEVIIEVKMKLLG